ncbi:hypothetical protein E4V42_09335 [Clostridium estertheticum]|uniref:WD40 repeat domain-containing protein n=1 Tax=Clostridium estertheticum TaxID=238834 RepID=A0A5N7J894_9CLOT|nr:hypothetical protein [Clostridium estertheticum]MPQ31641.1 hypothetical protein [Clostridium estertheticum]MPQ64959.1 hypothetical protein [Clostridium estertheticum]
MNISYKIDWEKVKSLSDRWIKEGTKYASAVNEFVRIGETKGWDKAGKEPVETRKDMALAVLKIIRQANVTNDIKNLKKYFPPASIPFLSLEKDEQTVIGSILLEDGSIILNVRGKGKGKNKVFFIDIERNIKVLENVIYVGKCPDKKYFAFAYENHIELHEGINGKVIMNLAWPTGLEGLKCGVITNSENIKTNIKDIIIFPNGKKILLISLSGIFVISEKEPVRLYPDKDLMSYILEEHEKDDEINFRIDMAHGAISSDGELIAIGAQDSNHLILDSNYKLISILEPESSYPHFTLFSKDNKHVIFNSCHFYNGCTLEVNINGLEAYENTIIDEVCRVYAGVARNEGYIIGDANGYIHFINMDREIGWRYYIGGTISSMDICNNQLLVGTYAGTAHLINLDTGKEDPYRIGNSTNIEEDRFLVWGSEKGVLQW